MGIQKASRTVCAARAHMWTFKYVSNRTNADRRVNVSEVFLELPDSRYGPCPITSCSYQIYRDIFHCVYTIYDNCRFKVSWTSHFCMLHLVGCINVLWRCLGLFYICWCWKLFCIGPHIFQLYLTTAWSYKLIQYINWKA
jgi:hypothetical protein